MKHLWPLALVLLLGSCAFEPDLSRFEPCNDAGQCPTGFLCLTEAQRCVPECGEDCPPGGDGGVDAGADAGVDAGQDAGVDAGAGDAGMEDAGPALALAATALAPAIETRAYSHSFMPTGGVGDYAFSMDGGVPGFTLSFLGELSSGAAPDAGTFPFSITVRDQASAVVTTQFSLEVRPLLRAANGVLVEGRQGQTYSQQLSATGGLPPYTWVVDGGTPPAGLSLSSGGLLQGTPSTASTVMFGVSVSDSATPPQNTSRMVSVQTRLPLVGLAILTTAAADGRVGTPYSQPLKAYGGTPAYTWSVATGTASLPSGVTLTSAGSDWALSGTPNAKGTFNFTLHCEDNLLAGQDQPLSITIY